MVERKERNSVDCKDISESSGLVWELLCKLEDGDIDGKDAYRALTSDIDLRVFHECFLEMQRKHIAEVDANPTAERQIFYCAAESKHESAIYRQQESYCEY